MKANNFFCGLTCMDDLFTTKIAMFANKINIVNFDFMQILKLYKYMYNQSRAQIWLANRRKGACHDRPQGEN